MKIRRNRILTICFLLFLSSFYSCSNEPIFPDNFVLENKKSFSLVKFTYLTCRLQTGILKTERLKDFPKNYKEFEVEKWQKFIPTKNQEHERILSILEEENEFDSQKILTNLIQNCKANRTLFAGYYEKSIGSGNEKYNYYDYLYFIDTVDNKLFKLEVIKDIRLPW